MRPSGCSAIRFGLLLFNLGCKIADGSAQCTCEPHGSVPTYASLAPLDPRDVGQVDPHASGQITLRDPGAVAQLAERSSENDLISVGVGGTSGVVVHVSLSPPRHLVLLV